MSATSPPSVRGADVPRIGRRPTRRTWSLLLALGCGAANAAAATALELRIPRLEAEVRIDGSLDEAAWQEALVFELAYETNPGENTPATVRTECRMFHDRRQLYYGCHAEDPEPETIRARFRDRDQTFSDDSLGLAIDPFDAQNRSYVLDLNPLGIQSDRLYLEADGSSDPTWDAVWSSAGRIVEDGWVVEAAIPFSSLRFPRTTGEQRWGFNFRRYRPREVLRRMALVPNDRSDPCRLCQSAYLVGFEGISAGRSIEVTPTLVGSQTSGRTDGSGSELETEDPDFDPGLDVRWGFTPNLSLNAAINPDFSQVEADVAQLDVNNQFALFFPERRPFFLEGSDYFATPLNVVYTRSVADPAWGLKISGKEGGHGLGVFVARDERTNLLLPGPEGSSLTSLDVETDDAVLRYRRDLWQSSTVGVLYTDRSGGDYLNRVAGVDARLRLGAADNLDFQLLGSRTRYPDDLVAEENLSPGRLDDWALFTGYRHRTRDWYATASYRDVGDDFRADLGFLPQVGYRQLESELGYNWYGDADHWFTELRTEASLEVSQDQEGNRLVERALVYFDYQGPLQSSFYAGPVLQNRTFEGVDFEGQVGMFVGGSVRPSADLVLGFETSFGDAVDFSEARPADSLRVSPFLAWGFGRHFNASFNHTYSTLDVEGGTLFDAFLSELRLVYQLNRRAFFRVILQHQAIDRDPDLYRDEVDESSRDLFGDLLFAWKLDPQTAVYVGYTGEYEELDGSGLLRTGDRLFFKLGYQWRPQ